MAQQNSIANKSSQLTIDPGASGDSFVQFDINTTGEFRIGVDDTDDSFRISQGSALGTNDTFIMSAAGERTMPLQPAFLAFNSATDANVTGNSVAYTVIFDSEVFDQNADYNNATGVFTAPVTGKYLFTTAVLLSEIGAAHTTGTCRITSSNGVYDQNYIAAGVAAGAAGNLTMGAQMIIDMDAADTASVIVVVVASTQTVDVYGNATNRYTAFSGALIA